MAGGRLVVAAQKTEVRHLDGGRVEQVLVADGDRVTVGQPLLRLDATALANRLEAIRRERFKSRAVVERLTAERDKLGNLAFSQGLLGDIRGEADRAILDSELALFERRRQAVVSAKAVQEQRSRQATTQIVGLNRAIWSMRERARLLDKDFAGLNEPGAERRVADTERRELWRRLKALIDEIAASEAEVARLRESIARNSQQTLLRQREYRREVATTLRNLQTGLIALEARHVAVAEKLARVVITAP